MIGASGSSFVLRLLRGRTDKEWIGHNAEAALFMTSGSGGCSSDCDDDCCVIDLNGTRSVPYWGDCQLDNHLYFLLHRLAVPSSSQRSINAKSFEATWLEVVEANTHMLSRMKYL